MELRKGNKETEAANIAHILLKRMDELEKVIIESKDLGEDWELFDECKYLIKLITYERQGDYHE
ncbi:hypothetical protein [Erysipelothrix aquatica]|uniref:hypothetical protein n=1 Tax=Erysipelothrix aquatica TaxID=2683714 RepID=UPI00135BDC80|nr:hypothetical protein [Erysipelothrix aquatica]